MDGKSTIKDESLKQTKMEITTKDREETQELLTRNNVPETPFTIVGTPDGYFGSMGKYRVTELCETEEEAKEACTAMTWNNIVNTILLLINHNENNK